MHTHTTQVIFVHFSKFIIRWKHVWNYLYSKQRLTLVRVCFIVVLPAAGSPHRQSLATFKGRWSPCISLWCKLNLCKQNEKLQWKHAADLYPYHDIVVFPVKTYHIEPTNQNMKTQTKRHCETKMILTLLIVFFVCFIAVWVIPPGVGVTQDLFG